MCVYFSPCKLAKNNFMFVFLLGVAIEKNGKLLNFNQIIQLLVI